jgi:hypothetical protein
MTDILQFRPVAAWRPALGMLTLPFRASRFIQALTAIPNAGIAGFDLSPGDRL